MGVFFICVCKKLYIYLHYKLNDMKNYIAYYRVSTKEQGNSGLGLLSQKQSVEKFVGSNGIMINEYQEVESGKKSDRPQLLKAIEDCKDSGATLVIAKLDRLSRNASFTLLLQNSGVDFVCVDMPNANTLTIGIMALLAEDEAKRISERTKNALSEIKNKIARGEEHISKSGKVVKSLGNGGKGLSKEAIAKGREVRINKSNTNPETIKVKAFVEVLVQQGLRFKEITDKLNEFGFKTPRGCVFTQTQVQRVYNKQI